MQRLSVLRCGVGRNGQRRFREGLSCPTALQKEKSWKLAWVSNRDNQNPAAFSRTRLIPVRLNSHGGTLAFLGCAEALRLQAGCARLGRWVFVTGS